MALITGILNFNDIFTAKIPAAGGDPKFSASILLPPTDPQVPVLLAEVEAAKANTFPSGFPAGGNVCFDLYEVKVPPHKDYHNPALVGWYMFTCNAAADSRPVVVDENRQPVIDPSKAYGGLLVHCSAGISGYTKGTGGVGGWLNGVMLTETLGSLGRIDGRPSTEQMFANVGAAPVAAPAAAAPAAAAPAAPAPAAPAPAAPVALTMTAAANGTTYEAYVAAGWTDEQMIQGGVAQRPAFAQANTAG